MQLQLQLRLRRARVRRAPTLVGFCGEPFLGLRDSLFAVASHCLACSVIWSRIFSKSSLHKSFGLKINEMPATRSCNCFVHKRGRHMHYFDCCNTFWNGRLSITNCVWMYSTRSIGRGMIWSRWFRIDERFIVFFGDRTIRCSLAIKLTFSRVR